MGGSAQRAALALVLGVLLLAALALVLVVLLLDILRDGLRPSTPRQLRPGRLAPRLLALDQWMLHRLAPRPFAPRSRPA